MKSVNLVKIIGVTSQIGTYLQNVNLVKSTEVILLIGFCHQDPTAGI